MSGENEHDAARSDPVDDRWLARLLSDSQRAASDSQPAPASDEEIEADLLAQAVRRHAAREQSAWQERYDDEAVQRAADRAVESLRVAGQLAPAARRPLPETDSWWYSLLRGRLPAWSGAAAMTAVVVLAVLVILPGSDDGLVYPEPPVVRGGPEPISVTLVANAPRERATVIYREIEAAGLPVGIYQQGTTFIIVFDTTPQSLEAAAGIFRSLGIAPAAGSHRVEVRPAD